MKYLWPHLDEITSLLKNRTKVLLLDFDGTLTPIVNLPEAAKLSPEIRTLLQNLSQKPKFYLAVISGRRLAEIKRKIGLPNIIYGGNHGLEGEIFSERYSFPIEKKTLLTFQRIRKQLDKLADKFKGIFIENKSLTLSFHYRLANKQQLPTIKSLFRKMLEPYVKDGSVSIVLGKKVFDLCPRVKWNKGNFAKLLIKKVRMQTGTKPIAISIGDDITDEDIFRVGKKGVTIKVGMNHNSNAKYGVEDTKEVLMFLQFLCRIP